MFNPSYFLLSLEDFLHHYHKYRYYIQRRRSHNNRMFRSQL